MTREELREASRMICTNAREAHNVIRTELRFCPTLHTLEALTPRDAVDAVVEGVQASGEQNGVIICALRSHDAQHSMAMARLAVDTFHDTDGVVCGFDIAGDEGSFPLSLHAEAVKFCKRNGVPVTVHAGEWPGSIDNVSLALDLGVDRIGHGWSMALDAEVMRDVGVKGVLSRFASQAMSSPQQGRAGSGVMRVILFERCLMRA